MKPSNIWNWDEHHYLEPLRDLVSLAEASEDFLVPDRTGTGTYSLFGHQMRFNLQGNKVPFLTTKKLHRKSVIHELLWMISGSTNIKYLQENGVRIWDEWADANGELGPVYGSQWRAWPGKIQYRPCSQDPNEPWVDEIDYIDDQTDIRQEPIDQLTQLIEGIKTNPHGRRHIVSAWNVGQISDMKLPPCHMLFQFHVDKNGGLSCQLYQRSADMFLGVPFNIAFYSLLTHLVAQQCGLEAKEFIHTLGDYHLYANHIEQAKEQLNAREPYPFPTLVLTPRDSIDDYTFQDIKIKNYLSWPAIKAEVSV